ncbi:MAG: endolytic transglycosylase MltG [Chloroflexota bacterium]
MRRTLFITIVIVALLIAAAVFILVQADNIYGPASPTLGPMDLLNYSARLLWHDGILVTPRDPNGASQSFIVNEGEPVVSVALRLEQEGLTLDADAFLDYLIYTGLDTSIQAGAFELSPAMSIVDIARELQDATPSQVTFVVLPGWRMEEIAASLPTSGLAVAPEQFLAVVRDPFSFDSLFDAQTNEGFLYPDAYILPRETNAEQLVEALLRNFALHLTNDLRAGFDRQGLTVYQAVTLASMVEREAVIDEEKPLIASVFLNRLALGMKLDSDPTVQYAIGYDPVWWPNPLSLADLEVDSPFNTYKYAGLPPAPIANPGLSALRAVAFPAETPYYYFRARCDDSGYHVFAETFEEHISNGCQ